MSRPLFMFCASAVFTLGFLTIAEAQPGRGGGRGGPGGGGGFGGRGIGGPGIGGPGIGAPGIGGQVGPNRGFNNGWNQWGAPGIGLWYSPYSTWNVPYTTRGVYGTTVVPATPAVTTTVIPANAEVTSQYGLQVTRVFEGGAKKADLRSGDVILGIGKTRTESFEALQAALVGAKEVEIVFFNNESKKVEKLPVKVDDGKIGVEVVPVVMQ
jgi:hypothetical protein